MAKVDERISPFLCGAFTLFRFFPVFCVFRPESLARSSSLLIKTRTIPAPVQFRDILINPNAPDGKRKTTSVKKFLFFQFLFAAKFFIHRRTCQPWPYPPLDLHIPSAFCTCLLHSSPHTSCFPNSFIYQPT